MSGRTGKTGAKYKVSGSEKVVSFSRPKKGKKRLNTLKQLFQEADFKVDINKRYTDGTKVFDNSIESHDLVLQLLNVPSNLKDEYQELMTKEYTDFNSLYWNLPVFDQLKSVETIEKNKYFEQVGIQELDTECRICKSRKFKILTERLTAGDEASKTPFECMGCGFKWVE